MRNIISSGFLELAPKFPSGGHAQLNSARRHPGGSLVKLLNHPNWHLCGEEVTIVSPSWKMNLLTLPLRARPDTLDRKLVLLLYFGFSWKKSLSLLSLIFWYHLLLFKLTLGRLSIWPFQCPPFGFDKKTNIHVVRHWWTILVYSHVINKDCFCFGKERSPSWQNKEKP